MDSEVFIHPTAIVHPKAQIGPGTKIGPHSIVEEHVVLGKNCTLQSQVILRGHTRIGDEVQIFPFSIIGAEPQHIKYKGEPTTVTVGDRVVLREYVSIHRGTPFGTGTTTIGEGTYIMAYCHVAHDCSVGKNAILANVVHMAGHTMIQDYAVVGGQSALAQHCRVGRFCYVGGGSIIRKDLPPFVMGKGNDFEVQGINVVGLKRHGFSSETVSKLRNLYKIFFLQNLTSTEALEKIGNELGQTDEVKVFTDFVKESHLGIVR